jgi:ABC-2 type transport system permease protein
VARHFVRLKLTLLAAGLRLNWQQAVGFVLSVVFGIPLAIGGFALLMWLGGETAGGSGLRLAFASLTLIWVLGPPLLFGLDETLDPVRLQLLPLTRRQLTAGLLASSAVGVGPTITALALLGAVAGFAPRGPGAVLVVAAVTAQLVLCLVVARAVTTMLSRWLRSRRGQDVLVLTGALLGFGVAGLGQLPNLLLHVVGDYRAFAALLERVESVVGATPLAWAGSSVVAASEGRYAPAFGWLALTVALVAGLAALWIRVIAGAAVTASGGRERQDGDLFAGLAGVLPRNRLGAAAARELRYQWRVPQLRVQWLLVPVLGVALVVGAVLAPDDVSPLLVFGVCGLVALQATSAINAFGGDRGAVWALVCAGGIGRADLAGKNLAGALVLLPLAAAVAAVLAALTGGWVYVPAAVLGCVTVLGCVYGLGNLASVLVPAPLPESSVNAWAGVSGAGCAAAFAQAVALMIGMVLLTPAALAVGATVAFASPWLVAVGLLVAAYGAGVWWLGLVLAARTAGARGPELVGVLSKKA